MECNFILFSLSYLFFFFFLQFLGPHLQHTEIPRPGVESECSRQPMPQPQKHRIWAESVTYTTAHGNLQILNPLSEARDGTPSSWILVRFVNCWATKGTPILPPEREELFPFTTSTLTLLVTKCTEAFLSFLGLHLQHIKLPRIGVKSAYTTSTQDLSCICNLHHSSWQC